MNFKKIGLVTLVLLAILTISAVSAAEDISVNDTQDSIELSANDDAVIADDENDDDYNYDDENEEEENLEYSIWVDEDYYVTHTDNTLIDWEFVNCGEGGNLTIYLDGEKIKSYPIEKEAYGSASAEDLGINLTYDTYTLDAVYSGDSLYEGFNKTYTITGTWMYYVGIAEYYYDMNYYGFEWGNEIGFNVYTYDAKGEVTCYINGKKYKSISTDVLNEQNEDGNYKGNFIVPGDKFDIGENTVKFTYTGKDYPETSREIEITTNAKIKFKHTISFDEDVHFTLALPSDAKGDLNVYLVTIGEDEWGEGIITSNELIASGPVTNGVADVVVSNLEMGQYYFYANYTGDDYTAVLGEFEDGYYYDAIVRVTPKIDIPSTIYWEETHNVTITLPESYEGVYTLRVGDETRNTTVKNGKGSIELFNLESGYTYGHLTTIYVRINFEGENYSYYNDYNIDISDIMPETPLDISVRDAVKGVKLYYYNIKNMFDDMDGDLKIYIDGEHVATHKVYDNEPLDISNLEIGEHTIKFEYTGGTYYRPPTETYSFNVSDVVIEIDKEITVGTYKDDYNNYFDRNTARIYSIYDNGYYSLIIDGKVVDMDVAGTYIDFDLSYLAQGIHEIEIDYKAGSVEKSKKQTVNATYALFCDDIPYSANTNNNYTIHFMVPLELSGNLLVSFDKNYTLPMKNGTAELTISNLKLGEYKILTQYEGGEYPELTKEYGTITVDEYGNHRLIYTPNDYELEYGEDLIIYADFSEDTIGNLSVSASSVKENIRVKVPLVNGQAKVVLNLHEFGEYIISATITDNDWESFDNNLYEIFYVRPTVDGSADIFGQLHNFGEELKLPVEFSGKENGMLYVYGDKKQTKLLGEFKVENGKATISINDFMLSTNNIYLKYEDENMSYFEEAFYVSVLPNLTYPEKMAVGSDEYLIMTLPSDAKGKLTVFGIETELVDGIGKIPLSSLSIGSHLIDITYEDDEIYGTFSYQTYEAWANAKYLLVTKPESEITAEKINDTLSITLSDDATGGVIAKIGDDFYYAPIENSEATITGIDLTSVENITLSYTGNNKYNSISKKSVNVKEINKQDSGLNVSAENVEVGKDIIISIKINPNVTGKVTLDNETVAITEGIATFTISNLDVGNYTKTVVFEGDKYFNADEKTVAFSVSRVQTPEKDPFEGDNETQDSKNPTYSINLPNDATGTLTVTIGNETYTSELVNGSASITIAELPAGEYNVTVAYSGDAKYAPMVKTTTATVKVDPRIDAKDMSVQYYAGKYYQVTVYGDDGKVASDASVTFTLNGKKITTTKTNENGVAKFKVTQTPVTKGKLVISALGTSVTKKLTVKRVIVLKKATVKKSAKKLVLTATLKKVNGKYLKAKKITFKFNGKKYAAKTSKKGIAKVTIKSSVLKKLKVGKKVTYQATYVKDTVKKTVKVQR